MINLTNTTIPAVFQKQCVKYGKRPCVSYRDQVFGRYVDISWHSMNGMVHELGYYLLSLGVKKGDRVALFSPNRPEWWVADLAILSIGAVNVPVYATNSAEEAEYVLKDSGSKVCIAAEKDHADKVISVKKRCRDLKKIVVLDPVVYKNAAVISLKAALEAGGQYRNKKEFDRRMDAVRPHDMATIIYTSGTTGDPKGVMLTHDNFVSNVRQVLTEFRAYLDDRYVLLSFLPLSHSLERTAGYYLPLAAGCRVAFAENFSKVVDNMREVRPSIIISVPRLYEKIHSTILARVQEAPPAKRMLFSMAVATARRNLRYICANRKPRGLLGLRVRLFDRLVFSKFKEGLGMDRLEYAVSGGAPLSVSDAEFFIGMGIIILEGFGLTETTPITNVNRLGNIKPGTVGPPVPETEVKISDEGEYLIRGPQVMKGYYRNPAATKEVFTKDGFFRTGDMAVIDRDGNVAITGRIKDIIITSGGKNISPQNIENSLLASPYIEQVGVIGDRRKYLTALIVPSFEATSKWAKGRGLSFQGREGLVTLPEVKALIEGEVARLTGQFSRVEQIKFISLLPNEWTQETGEITPSLKVKRKVVAEKYAGIIESMYPEDSAD